MILVITTNVLMQHALTACGTVDGMTGARVTGAKSASVAGTGKPARKATVRTCAARTVRYVWTATMVTLVPMTSAVTVEPVTTCPGTA